MGINDRISLSSMEREIIWNRHQDAESGNGDFIVSDLAREFNVSRPTIYKVLQRARLQEFAPRKSINRRFVESAIEVRRVSGIDRLTETNLRNLSSSNNTAYPGRSVTYNAVKMRFPGRSGSAAQGGYLHYAIDDHCLELYASIYPSVDCNTASSFLATVLNDSPYRIDSFLLARGRLIKGSLLTEIVQRCKEQGVVIRTVAGRGRSVAVPAPVELISIITEWHSQTSRTRLQMNQGVLNCFMNYYNTVRPNSSLGNITPHELLGRIYYSVKRSCSKAFVSRNEVDFES